MTLAELTEVWRPLDIAFALLEGLLFGYLVVGRFATDPAYASGDARPSEYGVLTALVSSAAGLMFFAGQIVASYYSHDAGWTRVVSRYGIWVVFGVAIGIGLWLRLRRHLRRKHAEAHERAVSELEARS